LRTAMAPIRPGAKRCGKLVTEDRSDYRSASVYRMTPRMFLPSSMSW
jgi:hypothetical protein